MKNIKFQPLMNLEIAVMHYNLVTEVNNSYFTLDSLGSLPKQPLVILTWLYTLGDSLVTHVTLLFILMSHKARRPTKMPCHCHMSRKNCPRRKNVTEVVWT